MRRIIDTMLVTSASFFLALTLAGCKRPDADKAGDKAKATAETAPVIAVPSVRFTKIAEKKLPAMLEVSGSLVADQTSEVASQGAGVVVSVEVDVGTRVKKGDVLVRLDSRDASLRVAQANAAALQASSRLGLKKGEKFDAKNIAEVRAAKESMDLAVSDADRTKVIFQAGGVPQATWDQARARAEQARAQYDAALNGIESAWAGLAAAQAQAGLAQKAAADTLIRAPFDGAVAERRISAGEFASMGRVVVVIVHDDILRLKVDVAEADASKISLDKDVVISVAAYPGRVFHGVIKRIGASLKAQSRALPIEAEIKNADHQLLPGFFARAQITVDGEKANSLLVPRSAIGTTGTASRVFTRTGNRVTERIITLGRESDGLVEVRGALSPNDEVAIDHLDLLQDGVEVKPAS